MKQIGETLSGRKIRRLFLIASGFFAEQLFLYLLQRGDGALCSLEKFHNFKLRSFSNGQILQLSSHNAISVQSIILICNLFNYCNCNFCNLSFPMESVYQKLTWFGTFSGDYGV